MALSGWDNKYSVNILAMDKDHQKLIEMISNLHQAMKSGQSKTILTPLLSNLTHYAQDHFASEEKYLSSIGSSELVTQKQQHVTFLNKIGEFKSTYEAGNTTLAIQILPFLNNWFLNHIMQMDMKYKQ
ncbi:MAG: bacteriohemerythrin [Sporomusaceae bacterium]|nr:bacteriohemerythrin [Sporomusaceae bacterium]